MRVSVSQLSLAIIAIILVFVTLHQAKAVFAPILAAFLLGIVLTPLSSLWEQLRVPDAIAAFLSVSFALLSIFVILLLLEPYVTAVIQQAPIIKAELRETIDEARRLLRGIERVSDEMAEAIDPNGGQQSDETEAMALPTISDALFYAPQFLSQFLIFSGALYFFLLTRNSIYHWLSETIAPLGKADLRLAARQVSRYVLTIATINASFGVIVAIVMQLIGVPSPIVWGLLAFLLNFILYLGPACLVVALTITGIVAFDGAMSFLPAALYIFMNAIEAQFVTPTAVGKSLSVNPLLVFLSLVFWLWMWGPIGGIIAIPLVIWTLTIFDGFKAHAISAGTPGNA